MNRITIDLSPEWVLSCAPGGTLPGDAIAEYIHANKLGTVKEQSFTGVVIESDSLSQTDLPAFKERLLAHLSKTFQESIQQLNQTVSMKVEQVAAPEGKPEEPKPEKEPEPEKKTEPQKPEAAPVTKLNPAFSVPDGTPAAMDRIRKLQGASQFISLCEQIQKIAPLLCSRNLQTVFTTNSYIFSIDTGCGHSTALKLFAQLLTEVSLFPTKDAPLEMKLEAQSGQNKPLEEAAGKLSHARNKIVSLDISNWCDKVASPEFRDFLLSLQRNTDTVIYIFRVPYLERSVLDSIEEALSDVMRVSTVAFTPLTAAQLQTVSEDLLRGKGFAATPDAWEQFQHRLAEEKSDGRFYGIKTAANIVDDMIFLKLQSILGGTSTDDNMIEARELSGLTSSETQSVSAAALLGGMIGIESIRDRIYEIISQIEFARKTPGVSAPAMHMRFVGCPGTGKTTVARIVGQLLKERGILSKGYFFEHSGGDFIGMYVGHTAPKTLALCRDAYGSVLFIDEAYTLANANYSNGDGYAKEAIDTLIAQMENHRDDMVVIMAGYPKEMNDLMRLNPGLSGRMPYVLEFPNYTRDQLAAIFASMVKKSAFRLAEGVQEQVDSYFANLDDKIILGPSFSNARFVRNIFERTWSKTVTRSQLEGSDPHIITADDFAAATADTTVTTAKAAKRSRPGYRLGLA